MRNMTVVCGPMLIYLRRLLPFALCVGVAAAQSAPFTSYTDSVDIAG